MQILQSAIFPRYTRKRVGAQVVLKCRRQLVIALVSLLAEQTRDGAAQSAPSGFEHVPRPQVSCPLFGCIQSLEPAKAWISTQLNDPPALKRFEAIL